MDCEQCTYSTWPWELELAALLLLDFRGFLATGRRLSGYEVQRKFLPARNTVGQKVESSS